MGKLRRLEKIFRADGNITIIAMEHPITSGPVEGLVKPADTIKKMVDGGGDAVITSIGTAKKFEKELARIGLIIRLDYPSSDIVSGVYDCELHIEVEEAVKVGADAVIITAGPGEALERKTFKNISIVARECEKYGMPFIAEMVPGGFNAPPEMINIPNLKLSARIAAEFGADMVKIPYRPGFEEVVEGCYLPVVVLGGAKTKSEEQFIAGIWDAIHCGARGVAVGRNIWGHSNPNGMLKALNSIVHDKSDVATALTYLK